jgi:tRNA G37 N-methylase Trm5
MNEKQDLLKIKLDIIDIKSNTLNNNILLNKVLDRVEELHIDCNKIQLDLIEEFEHIFVSGKNIFEMSDLFAELKDKYINRKGE